MDYQNTLRESTQKIEGLNAFNGNKNWVRFHAAEANTGLVVRVGGENIPVKLDRASLYNGNLRSLHLVNCIALNGKRQRAVEVEHLLSLPYALGIDNAIIELSDGSFPRQNDGMRMMAQELLSKRVALPVERKYLTVRTNMEGGFGMVVDKEAGDKLTVKPASGFWIDYTASYPHKSVGKQTHRFRLFDDDYQKEVMPARAIFFLPFGSNFLIDSQVMRFFHGVRDENSLFVGKESETQFLNRHSEDYGKEEFVRHKIYDVIGEMALTGRYFKNTGFVFDKTGHEFDLFALRTLFDRGCFEKLR